MGDKALIEGNNIVIGGIPHFPPHKVNPVDECILGHDAFWDMMSCDKANHLS